MGAPGSTAASPCSKFRRAKAIVCAARIAEACRCDQALVVSQFDPPS